MWIRKWWRIYEVKAKNIHVRQLDKNIKHLLVQVVPKNTRELPRISWRQLCEPHRRVVIRKSTLLENFFTSLGPPRAKGSLHVRRLLWAYTSLGCHCPRRLTWLCIRRAGVVLLRFDDLMMLSCCLLIVLCRSLCETYRSIVMLP